ncbi:MAG: chemotaxis response regulator protein-glutamate methylesterase [Pseudohongiella sp.]|nr:chemotaxis response regulator protein-glutamate methylesterase [Pseudohongiella sp.]MDO9520529.1 chemotaxis response regulator protein-glutamate methylesterase [Pseudohongiella sp.]
MKKIKVAIVDDSAVVRQVLKERLEADAGIVVSITASDPLFAWDKMKADWPDVVVLDVEMPRMDGISFLKQIMKEHPLPVVICSTLTEKGAATTMQAMDAGAISVVCKPKMGLKAYLEDDANNIVSIVKSAAKANVGNLQPRRAGTGSVVAAAVPKKDEAISISTTYKLIAVGASTGGTQAIEFLLRQLPRVCAGIVIVQHMPAAFTKAFADRLNTVSEMTVKEAEDGDRVLDGRCLIAPGGKHLVVKRSGAQYYVSVVSAPPVNRHCPSVDVLFRSVARTAGRNALGIILTGMGDDGASGLLEMRDSGAMTIAQDEASCVVFGMPKEAIKLDAAIKVVALTEIPRDIQNWK